MKISRVKFGVFLGGLAVAIPLTGLSLMLLMQSVASFRQGADPASIFKGNKLIVPSEDQAQWIDTTANGYQLTQGEQEELLAAYWDAWQAFNRAQSTGNTDDLATYWAGTAIGQIEQSIDPNRSLKQTDAGHQLSLQFLSDDRSVVLLQDNSFMLQHFLNGKTLTFTVSATVLMTIDNGFWRIRLLELHYQ